MPVTSTDPELIHKIADLERQIKELKMFRSIFQTANDAMCITNLEGNFLDVNAKLCATLGYSREELLQMRNTDLKPVEQQDNFNKNMAVLRKKGFFSYETVSLHKNGTPISLEIRSSICKLDGESVIQVVARNITKRKQREKILHSYEQIFSVTDDLLAFVDTDYIYQLVNKKYSTYYKQKEDDILGQPISAIVGEKCFQETIKPQFDRCLSGETVHYQAWFELDNLGQRFKDISYYPHRSSDGDITGILSVIHDLTDLELAKEEREAERERLNSILQATPDGVYIVDRHYTIEYINPVIEKEFGSVNDRKCYEYLHYRTEPCRNCQKENVFSGNSIQREWRSTDTNKEYEIFDSPLKNADGIFAKVAFFHDVTEKKKMQQALEKNEMLLRCIVNNSSNVIYVKDREGRYLMVNTRFTELFNREAQDIIGRTDFDLFPEEQAHMIRGVDQTIWKSKEINQSEQTLTLQDKTHMYMTVKFPLLNSQNSMYAVAGISTDISKYKQLEHNLQENNKHLTALINASPDIICCKDGEGKWLLANEAILQLFQLAGVDYKGKTDAELAHYSEFYHEALLACVKSDEEAWHIGTLSRGKEIIPKPDGEDSFFDIIKVPLFHSDGTRQGLVVIAHDITKHLKIERKLRREIVVREQTTELMQKKSNELEEANIALRVLVKQQKDIAGEVQQDVLVQLEKAVLPYISLLHQSPLDDKGKEYLDIISSHLSEVGKSFIKKLSNPDLKLTRKEILVADLVRQGKSTKEIAQLLTLKVPSVEAYRNKIRKKLSLNKKKISLYQYLSVTFETEN